MSIPNGATHKQEFYGDIIFWKINQIGLNFIGDGYPEPKYAWFYWDNIKKLWVKSNPCSRNFIKL